MTWATAAETLALTGVSVTTTQLAQAQGIIDVFSGVVEDAVDDLTVRDRRLLRYATAYQAAWMTQQIDVTSRTDVSSLDQDGITVTLANQDALVLAPLAVRCLKRLSWLGSRSVQVVCGGVPHFRNWEAVADAWLKDELPTYDGWQPL